MVSKGKNIMLFSGNSNIELAKGIANDLGLSLGAADVKKFSDGEVSVSLGESVRGRDIFVIQSLSQPTNDNVMELLIMLDALKRASAGRITAVIPYFGYARQDRKAKERDPISAKLMADIITVAGANSVLTMDLHAAQIQGFFNIPVDNLLGVSVLAPYFAEKFGKKPENLVLVSPDHGSVTRVRKFSKFVDAPLAIIDKRRPEANKVEVMSIIGDVRGKEVLLIDDMIDTAGTLCKGAEALIEVGGATKVYACASHGVLSGPAMERLEKSPISELILLDTIKAPENAPEKIKFLSSAHVFAEAIKRIYEDESVSELSSVQETEK
ncbi:MAG: ribose-phosphate pyrophosphokinase [Clostridia bacterium]|nr:ribose-phosphate pyrophosphokinase [Clostridia bacterium]